MADLEGPSGSPEHRELAKKMAELGQLKALLIEKELLLKTVTAELNDFYRQYLRILGARYAWLDDLKAQIAEEIALQNSNDVDAQKRATDARTKAGRSVAIGGSSREKRFAPSESLKKRYREAAKCVHPDLALTEDERARRHRVMQDVNHAYEAQDEARLTNILRDWHDGPDGVQGDGIGAELIRIIRTIAQVERRLEVIEKEIHRIRTCYIYGLRTKAQDASARGEDLLEQMAAELDDKIARAEDQLASVKRQRKARRGTAAGGQTSNRRLIGDPRHNDRGAPALGDWP